MDVCSLEDLRQRFEPPNESNRWDCPLFKVHMGRCQSPPPDGLHLHPHLLGPSSAAPKAIPPGTRPGLTKSSFKRAPAAKDADAAPGAALADPVPVAIAEGPSIPAAGSSVSFSGTAAVARDVDADPSFQDPEQVVRAICAHFFSGDGRAPAPAPANPSTAPLLRGDAALLYELDRTSMRILQAR
jgi:hypothetical protein